MIALPQKDLLLLELRKIAALGPIRAVSSGSNSIGKTLQSALGIIHSVTGRNAKFGYTVTSTRSFRQSSGRTNLFACVADWDKSAVKSSTELVEKYGRPNREKGYENSLFCTTSALNTNSFGLTLSVDFESRRLSELFVSENIRQTILNWDIGVLESKLEKLGYSAIVTGLPVDLNGEEGFHFRYVEILGKPRISAFLELVEDGAITVDHCISQRTGSRVAREQGPLFKLSGDARDLLYDSVERFDLLEM